MTAITEESTELAALASCRYVHITGLDYYVDDAGRHYVEPLWHKDLMQHLRYLPQMTLVAGHDPKLAPPPDSVPIEGELARQLRFVPIPYKLSWPGALICSPVAAWRMWRAVRDADLVFAGFIEWPIPFGWIATPIIRLLRKPYYTFFDSAFWRLPDGVPKPVHRRVRGWFTEGVNRLCLRHIDLAFITQEAYRDAFRNAPERAHLIHASWIDEANVLSDAAAMASWSDKTRDPEAPLRILFVGRLEEDKGVRVLLDAFSLIDPETARVQLDVLGKGALESACTAAAKTSHGDLAVRYLGTVPYEDLFDVIRDYHAVIVPSISDEQPRIVYDAFSQAVPVIASDTTGLRDCVEPEVTGLLVPANDAPALARAIERVGRDRSVLERLGTHALAVARGLTHTDMHAQRRHLLYELIAGRLAGRHSPAAISSRRRRDSPVRTMRLRVTGRR